MYYYIKNTLERTETPDLSGGSGKFVAVLTSAQWLESRDRFDMGIEMDMDLSAIDSTKAEVNYDSLTGTFSVPDRENISAPNINFAFALDEKGIVFIDDSGFVSSTIGSIISSKRWAAMWTAHLKDFWVMNSCISPALKTSKPMQALISSARRSHSVTAGERSKARTSSKVSMPIWV